MIELKNVNKIYENKVQALTNIDLTFNTVGMTFIVGKSGSGKSTLLNVLGCLDTFESGQYSLYGKDISKYSLVELDRLRNHYFGFIFQDYLLVDNMNVFENIALALDLQNDRSIAQIDELMKKLDIYDLKERKINELSGGQKQRIAIARALIKNPTVILADEPTGNLDEKSSKNIYELLASLSKDYLVIIVSHDLTAAEFYADRIIEISDSYIVNDKVNTHTKYDVYNPISKKVLKLNATQQDIMNFVHEACDSITIKINKKQREPSNVILLKEKETNNTLKLPNQVILKYIKNSIRKNKLKYFFSTIFYSLTFFILLIFAFISNYDSNIVIENYIDKYNVTNYSLYKEVSYTDKFYQLKEKTIYNGEVFKKELNQVYDSLDDMKESTIQTNEHSFTTNVIFTNNNSYNLNDNNIVITDYLKYKYSINIGDTVYLFDTSYVVSEIINTSYEQYDLTSKLLDFEHKIYAENRIKTEYNVCYLSTQEKHEICKSISLEFKASNFFISDLNDTYFSSYVSYESVSNVAKEQILLGRLPKADNEVVISQNFIESNFKQALIGDFLNNSYTYKDLALSSYNGYYSDCINMFNYYKNGVVIVGITNNNESSVYISDNVYNDIIRAYSDYYFTDLFIAGNLNSNKLSLLSSHSIKIDEPNIGIIYNTIEFLETIIIYFRVVLTILILITIFMVLNFVLTQISSSKKQIGIMKALGVTNHDIIKLFIIEIVLLGTITLALSYVIYGVSLIIINSKFMLSVYENSFSIVYFDTLSIALVSIFVLGIFLLSSIIPIIKIANNKPMVSIRNN